VLGVFEKLLGRVSLYNLTKIHEKHPVRHAFGKAHFMGHHNHGHAFPRQIDHLTSTVLERSDRIFVVLQQSISHVRDANRLLGILRDELSIPDAQPMDLDR